MARRKRYLREAKAELINLALKSEVPEDAHLIPETSAFSPPFSETKAPDLLFAGHLAIARTLLKSPNFGCDEHRLCNEIASLVCLPSVPCFGSAPPPWAVWVAGDWRVEFLVLSTEAEKPAPRPRPEEQDSMSVGTKHWHCQITKELGSAICDVWKDVLLETRYPRRSLSLGYVDEYHFVYWRNNLRNPCYLAGQISEPPETTGPGRLVALAENLRKYAQHTTNGSLILNAIEGDIQWFQTRPR